VNNEVVKYVENTGLIIGDDMKLTKAQVKRHFAPNATDDELVVFMLKAHACNLNPIKGEIQFVKFGSGPGTAITSYQVYLNRAQQSGNYGGISYEFDGDGPEPDCIVTVRRKDWQEPFIHRVPFKEVAYIHTKQGSYLRNQYKNNPKFMHMKTAIKQALVIAFPETLSNMPYMKEELQEEPARRVEYADVVGIETIKKDDMPWSENVDAVDELELFLEGHYHDDHEASDNMMEEAFGTRSIEEVRKLPLEAIREGFARVKSWIDGEETKGGEANETNNAPESESPKLGTTDCQLHTSGASAEAKTGAGPLPNEETAPVYKDLKTMYTQYKTLSREPTLRSGLRAMLDETDYDTESDPAGVVSEAKAKHWQQAGKNLMRYYQLL